MKHNWFFVTFIALVLLLSAAQAPTPKEAVGFWGTVTGVVKSAQADGKSFVLTVSKAEADEKNSKIKDTAPMIGKALSIGTRMPVKDGKPSFKEEDVAYIKTLKPGMSITAKIFAVRSDPRVLRLQAPGQSTTKPAAEDPAK